MCVFIMLKKLMTNGIKRRHRILRFGDVFLNIIML